MLQHDSTYGDIGLLRIAELKSIWITKVWHWTGAAWLKSICYDKAWVVYIGRAEAEFYERVDIFPYCPAGHLNRHCRF